jgi:hypothetical protein
MDMFPICSHTKLRAFLIGSTQRHNLYEERKSRKAHLGNVALPYSIVFTGVNNNFWLLSGGPILQGVT